MVAINLQKDSHHPNSLAFHLYTMVGCTADVLSIGPHGLVPFVTEDQYSNKTKQHGDLQRKQGALGDIDF